MKKGLSARLAGVYDGFVGGLMIAAFGITFGAYCRFTIPTLFVGFAYLFIQKRLRKNEGKAVKGVSAVLRVFGTLWLCFVVWTVFGVGKNDPKLYGIKKSLYLAGNYSDSSILDFMPDKIPDCSDYAANIVPPMTGQDAYGYINIRFKTDSSGIDYLRSQAESRGGEHYYYPPDEALAETEPYNKLRYYAKFMSTDSETGEPSVTELYIFDETRSRHKSCYLLNAETGQAVINW